MKKSIQVTLHMSEITYDIMNNTYLKGVHMDDGTNFEASYNVQIDDRDENRNKMLRSISTSWANLRLALRKYLNMPSSSSDNILVDDHGEITVMLQMPMNFNESNTLAIASMLHQYIVNYSIAEWLAISSLENAKQFYADANSNMINLQRSLNSRSLPAPRVGRRDCEEE